MRGFLYITTMDHWGALQSLNRKQQAEKRRIAEIRAIYTKRRKSFIHTNSTKNNFEFPQLTPAQFKEFKNKIRKEYKTKRILNFIFSTALFLIILFGFVLLFYKKGYL